MRINEKAAILSIAAFGGKRALYVTFGSRQIVNPVQENLESVVKRIEYHPGIG